MWYRLMDAVDPALVDRAEETIRRDADVQAVEALRMRWVGHSLHLEATLALAPRLTTAAAAAIADRVRHALLHAIPNLADVRLEIAPARDDPPGG